MASSVRQNYTPSDVVSLIPKFLDSDSDIRFMSLVDLCNILNAGPQTLLVGDLHTAAKVVDCLIVLLDDTNGDVQSQALKSLGPLALKSNSELLCPFIEKLTSLETPRSLDSSIPATATRTLVTALPRPVLGVEPSKQIKDAYSAISKVLIPRLLGYIVIHHGTKSFSDVAPGMLVIHPDKGADVDLIDLTYETVRCYGPMLQEAEKLALQKRLMEILDDERTGTVAKKKVVATISLLAVYMSDALLSTFLATLGGSLQTAAVAPVKQRLLISMLGSVARSIPRRFGPYVSSFVPFILGPLEGPEENLDYDSDSDGVDIAVEDVKEAALSTLDDFLASCSSEMRPHTEAALGSGLRYISYDPSLALDEDDEDTSDSQDNAAIDSGLEDEDYEEEATLSDGDDSSWKIRRCATKVLYTIISTRGSGDLLENGTLYEKVAPVLIKSFREREENVRLEILATLTTLIRKTGEGNPMTSGLNDEDEMASASAVSNSRKRRRGGSDASMFDNHISLSSSGMISPTGSPSPTSGPRADLARVSHSMVRGVVKLLRQSSVSTKQAGFTLLRAFILVQHAGLAENLGQVIDPMMDAIKTPNTLMSAHSVVATSGGISAIGGSLRSEALQLLRALCDTHSSKVISPLMGKIVPILVLAVKDKYFRVSAEAIGVAESVVKVITPPRSSGVDGQHKIYIESLFDIIVDKARAHDTDVEVRQRAIHALGVMLARSATSNTSKPLAIRNRSRALDTLLERLKNETTRLASVRAIEDIAVSTTEKDEFKPEWVQSVALELAAHLRKVDRALRVSSLSALKHLTGNTAAVSSLTNKHVQGLVELLLPIIDPHSLGLLGMALGIFADLAKQSPKQVASDELNRALCSIAITPLAGHVLEAFLGLVNTIGTQGVGRSLMQALLKDVGVSGDPSVVGSAIGVLLVSGGSSVGVSIKDIMTELRTAQDDRRKCLALSILGEASLRLSNSSPLQPKDFLSYFASKSDRVPRAAAVALGRAGAGNTSVYMPVILSMMDEPGPTQLLLMYSIKEVLQHASESRIDISEYTQEIWRKLIKVTEDEDNKAIGAECVGRLISVEPKRYLPLLQNYLREAGASIRGMVIQALRFALTDADESFDEALKPILIGMLSTMLNDISLENRRLALITLNSAIQNKAALILPHLSQLLPFVIKESNINPNLVREVQMGPFKHKVDDGLELRKSAYETLHALMNTAFARMNPMDLFDRVIAGLQDEHDIKMLCNLMLTKLTTLDPEETIRRLDIIAERFQATLSARLKDNAVKQELEKAQEAKMDVIRVTARLHFMLQSGPSSALHTPAPVWRSYWEFVVKEYKTQLASAEASLKSQR